VTPMSLWFMVVLLPSFVSPERETIDEEAVDETEDDQ
jgi:hypothetical protein